MAISQSIKPMSSNLMWLDRWQAVLIYLIEITAVSLASCFHSVSTCCPSGCAVRVTTEVPWHTRKRLCLLSPHWFVSMCDRVNMVDRLCEHVILCLFFIVVWGGSSSDSLQQRVPEHHNQAGRESRTFSQTGRSWFHWANRRGMDGS